MHRFPHNDEGQGLVEYALILVLVAVVVIVILALLGPAIGNIFSNIIDSLNSRRLVLIDEPIRPGCRPANSPEFNHCTSTRSCGCEDSVLHRADLQIERLPRALQSAVDIRRARALTARRTLSAIMRMHCDGILSGDLAARTAIESAESGREPLRTCHDPARNCRKRSALAAKKTTVREIIIPAIRDQVASLEVDALGNLTALANGYAISRVTP